MGFMAKDLNGVEMWYATTIKDGLEPTCDGFGTLYCYCGGDTCVCGNYGEAECYGCTNCDNREDYESDLL